MNFFNELDYDTWCSKCVSGGILIGKGLFGRIGKLLTGESALSKISCYVIITDQNLNRIYGTQIEKGFASMGVEKLNFLIKVVPPGERSKNRAMKAEIEDFMLENKCGRDTCIVAIGGGVIGDLSGYVAATYARGIPFVQVPTSLLAMVDSSIGGKTGIDVPAGKNLIGAFHFPTKVIIDVDFLKTLPFREFKNGMSEVIKTAIVWDSQFFNALESLAFLIKDEFLAGLDYTLLERIVAKAASIKNEIVTRDFKEANLRSILNFGHTIGHAIEAEMSPNMLHGECVSIGMVVESKLSDFAGHLVSSNIIERISKCISKYELPTLIPCSLCNNESEVLKLIDFMKVDKKNANQQIRMVMLKDIGMTVDHPVSISDELLMVVLSPSIRVVPHLEPMDFVFNVPGSKSISNRILMLCALAEGQCKISSLLHAEDTEVMLNSLSNLEVKFHWEENDILVIEGTGGRFKAPRKPFFFGNSGTTSRFLTTMCTLVEEANYYSILDGNEYLRMRPIKDLIDSLASNGHEIAYLNESNFFPIKVRGGGLRGGIYTIQSHISSQFISSLLISAPYASSPITIVLTGKTVSQPFIDITIKLMERFGIQVKSDPSSNSYFVPNGVYRAPKSISIESDATSASYPFAIAAISNSVVTVPNITNGSIQSDSYFPTRILSLMGCEVERTDEFTTVKGPRILRGIGEVDMNEMTDTFMTLAVLAAVAEGTTRIVNIANQRVKECDRITAMATQLRKIGFSLNELQDGLEIYGTGGNLSNLKNTSVECYGDHRMAMSFAVLSYLVPGITILDKECVNKTFPGFWRNLYKSGIKLQGSFESVQISDASIVLIGMRGSGKTCCGKSLARHLNWKFIDMDIKFNEVFKVSIEEYANMHGWPDTREKEALIFHDTILSNPFNAIIATGGGVVESPKNRTLLRTLLRTNNIWQIRSTVNRLVVFNRAHSVAVWKEHPSVIWDRRKSTYEQLSNYEFFIPEDEFVRGSIDSFFSYTIQRIKSPMQPFKEPSYFVSLTFASYRSIETNELEEITNEADAIEIRVDMMDCHRDLDLLKEELAILRFQLFRAKIHKPLIYTVRSKDQGGEFAGDEELMLKLLENGIRSGFEYIDVEITWSEETIQKILLDKKSSRIIASRHELHLEPNAANIRMLFDKFMKWIRFVDVLKLVVRPGEETNGIIEIFSISKDVQKEVGIPVISIVMGEKGKISRVLNNHLTPVTHSRIGKIAAPGQLTIEQIKHHRKELGLE